MKSEVKLEKALKNITKDEPDITLELVKNLQAQHECLEDIPPEKLKEGIEVEMEHFDSVGGDMEIVAKIAGDHIKEYPNYYHELEEMENKLEKEVGDKDTNKEETENE